MIFERAKKVVNIINLIDNIEVRNKYFSFISQFMTLAYQDLDETGGEIEDTIEDSIRDEYGFYHNMKLDIKANYDVNYDGYDQDYDQDEDYVDSIIYDFSIEDTQNNMDYFIKFSVRVDDIEEFIEEMSKEFYK